MENDLLTPAKAIEIAVDKSRQFDETRKLLANLRKSIKENILKDLHDTFHDPQVSVESIVAFLNRIKNYKTLASKASEEVKKELYQSIEESLKMLFNRYIGISPKEDLEVLFEEYDIECFSKRRGFKITENAARRYTELTKIYGGSMLPVILVGEGLAYHRDGIYLSNQYMAKFITMNEKYKGFVK